MSLGLLFKPHSRCFGSHIDVFLFYLLAFFQATLIIIIIITFIDPGQRAGKWSLNKPINQCKQKVTVNSSSDPVATRKQSETLDGPPVKKIKKNVTFSKLISIYFLVLDVIICYQI